MAIDSLDGAVGARLLAAVSFADVAVSGLGGIRHLPKLDHRQAERTVLSSGRARAEHD